MMTVEAKSITNYRKPIKTDPETGLYLFVGHRKIRADILSQGSQSTLTFRSVLEWYCWACGGINPRHHRNIPLGCSQIDRWIILATCPNLLGVEIVLTEKPNRMTPDHPIVTAWDAFEHIAFCRPEYFGYEREIDYGHRREYQREFGWS